MGKSKRRKTQERREHNEKSNGGRPKFNVRDGPSRPKHQQSKSQQHAKAAKSASEKKASPASRQQQQNQDPVIPFDALERILVIGDGDLSYSRSLVDTHGCAALLATTYDSAAELAEKYPQAQENKEAIEAEEQRVLHGVDATKLGQREVKKQAGGWERVIFNFPHVGGKSTDVNRQVRYNQEMLVSFFGAVTPLLAPHGTVIVTLFEGEPYTLWNIRDLGRHAGLEVQRSFRFQADAYPGYAHARTLGNIEGGGGWKGEERLSRSYVFQIKGAGEAVQKQQAKTNKRKKMEESDDDDSDED
ncbi:hypothetical protein E4T38_02421 [Aureobasidium subglaciale]|nr:hypothetical protein E4T38_02421 [Aureobasidium subglaciale]KAI5228033.1 hypothetical protein E4T40_02200 [Aureobasidium subglaciale]KAI5231473.1 hypothetical protein E4T41_02420 [Aureobasidium subglaciale]KAI5265478.1 hypothetical protein E4T46_02198 [Aureobasidium subglaciale]